MTYFSVNTKYIYDDCFVYSSAENLIYGFFKMPGSDILTSVVIYIGITYLNENDFSVFYEIIILS
jgi:hypothetical protein